MKILIKKSVISGHDGWRNEGEIYELDQKTANHYIAKGIGVKAESHKEDKAPKETKEHKGTKKRKTKKSK